jgi:hypothetical protein
MPPHTPPRGGRVLAVLLSLAVAGCDEEAREFAEKTALILRQRSDQLARKIAAETRAYNAAAAHAAEARRALIDSSLANERTGRVIALAADYDEERKPVSRWRSELGEYAQMEYEASRELLGADVDASSRFLQNVHALALEQDRVDALARLLAALASKPTLAQDVAALQSFAEETRTEFDEKVCAQLESQKDAGSEAARKAFEAKKCAG